MKPVTRPRPELVSIDELDRAIVNLAARINAETYELLVLIRQFDERAECRSGPWPRLLPESRSRAA
ncbi:MAG: hypothetical protein IIB74_12760 [Proteobacteria bacterium]|nr:hypothetical protein [Pseudomonadota bacterium]